MSTSNALAFFKAFDQITIEIEFKPAFGQSTGYYDHAVCGPHAPVLPVGTIAKCVTDNGRKLICVSTRFGNAIIFQRYSDSESVIVGNLPREITKLYLGSSVGTNLAEDNVTLFMLLGEPEYATIYPNVGQRIENLFSAAREINSLKLAEELCVD